MSRRSGSSTPGRRRAAAPPRFTWRRPTGVRGAVVMTLAVLAVLTLAVAAMVPGARAVLFDSGPGASTGPQASGARDPSTTASSDAASVTASPTTRSASRPPRRLKRDPVDGPRITRLPSLPELVIKMGKRGFTHVEDPDETTTTRFRVASFNILGHGHQRRGFRNGIARFPRAMAMLRDAGVTVAGLQEFQDEQVRAFRRHTGDRWGVYPGLKLGTRITTHNSIIWRQDTWELVAADTSQVPYFGGVLVPMPHLKLRHRDSGAEIWFGNYHNPANARGPAARHRARAVAREAALVRRLTADGTPMIVTGDMNDRAEFACPFTRRSGMHSADGARTVGGSCRLPRSMNVDWILGSSEFEFSGFDADRSAKPRKISDHPLISATAALQTTRDTSQCRTRRSLDGTHLFCPDT